MYLTVVGLRCCERASSSYRRQGYSLCGLLTAGASPVAKHGLESAWVQRLWLTGLAAPQNVGSPWTRDQTHVLCFARRIHNHWTTRGNPPLLTSESLWIPTFIFQRLPNTSDWDFFDHFCHPKSSYKGADEPYNIYLYYKPFLINVVERLWSQTYLDLNHSLATYLICDPGVLPQFILTICLIWEIRPSMFQLAGRVMRDKSKVCVLPGTNA